MSVWMERKLAAIVAADVVGYSRLTGEDETGTINAVRSVQTDIIVPVITGLGGRLVKTMGDGFLMEFNSVVAAVEAAVEIQRQLSAGSHEDSVRGRITLRIGVHVGDVVTEGDDIFGNGVNIAARIEAMANPGGVGVSDDAHRQVRDRLAG